MASFLRFGKNVRHEPAAQRASWKRRSQAPFHPCLEPLETRLAPDCSVSGQAVNCDAQADILELRILGNNIQVYNWGFFRGNLAPGAVTVNGGGGFNNLTVNDSAFAGGRTYTFTNAPPPRITVGSFVTVSYVNITDVLRLETASGSSTSHDTINVNAVAQVIPPLLVQVVAGLGNDTINITPATGSLLSLGNASLVVHGGGGTDALILHDHQAGTAGTYTVTATAVWRAGGPSTSYFTVENVTLNASPGSDTIHVNGTAAGVTTTLSGGGGNNTVNVHATSARLYVLFGNGNDQVNISPASRNLDHIQGDVSIEGGTGRDTLEVHDQANAGAHTWTFTRNISWGEARRTGSALIRYASFNGAVEAVFMNAGAGASTFNVTDTLTNGLLTLDTGPGADTVNVLATTGGLNVTSTGTPAAGDTVNVGNAGRVQGIQGAVSISNQSGARTAVNVNNQNDSVGRTVTLDTVVQGPEFIRLNVPGSALIYSVSAQTSTFTVNGGQGNDTYNVRATAAGVGTFVNGGDGDDHYVAGTTAGELSTLLGDMSLNGQSGTNTLLLNDAQHAVGRSYLWSGDVFLRDGIERVVVVRLAVDLRIGRGDDTILFTGGVENPLRLQDAGGADTLFGPDRNSTWDVTVLNAGALNAIFFFAGVENLVGGAGDDMFAFAAGGSGSGRVDGGGGWNALDYSAWAADVYVNLQTGAATSAASGVANVHQVAGGAGNDILVGAGGNYLLGGPGRDLLIAGGFASWLDGGEGDDLLIGGVTSYDGDDASLAAIRDYWAGGDDYATRVANLTTGAGVPVLDATTVFSNGGGNGLFGGDGPDLFFGSPDFDFHDWDAAAEAFVVV